MLKPKKIIDKVMSGLITKLNSCSLGRNLSPPSL